MKKFVIWAIVLIIAAGAGLILAKYYSKNTQQPLPEQSENKAQSKQIKPWVEVVRPAVYVLNDDGSEAYELQTGDEIDPGMKLKTNENGLANIYFPNGSVARLDVNTQIIINEASYNDENQTMVVKIMLGIGRVWSKIFSLATPQSSWEVDTTNAVATVRGTAFGVEYENNNTNVVGSENEVAVSFIDPTTRKIIEGKQELISPDKVLAINDITIGKVLKGESISLPPIIMAAPNPVLSSEWVTRFQEADRLLEGKLTPINPSVKYIRPQTIKNVIQGLETTEQAIIESSGTTSDITSSSDSSTSSVSPTGATMQPSSQTTTTTTLKLNAATLVQPTTLNLLGQTVTTSAAASQPVR